MEAKKQNFIEKILKEEKIEKEKLEKIIMTTQDKNNQIIIYTTEDGETKIEVRMKDETVWLS